MKDTQNEIKQNIQGTISDRKETRTQSNDLEQKESNWIRMKKQEFQDNFKPSSIQIIGVPEENRKTNTWKTYLKK